MSTQATPPASSSSWTSTQAYVLAVICLLVGLAAGYLLRGSSAPSGAPVANANVSPAAAMPDNAQSVSPEQLAQMARTQAAPLLEQLKSSPNDASLLIKIASVYYDTQQYPDAITYYRKALQIRPDDVDARTDYGTLLWYQGDADAALAEYQKSLSYNPTHGGTLFNVGMVKWQGKHDTSGAIAAWEKLLQTNPNYPEKDHVVGLIAKAKEHASGKIGQKMPGAQ